MIYQMKVLNVAFFEQGAGFAVLLSDVDNKMILPIFIGPLEAQSIAFALENQQSERPLTHDLMLNIFSKYGINIQKIIITDIKDNTYYSEIFLIDNNNLISIIDARPSDAISLAIRVKCPIYMSSKLLEFTYKYDELMS